MMLGQIIISRSAKVKPQYNIKFATTSIFTHAKNWCCIKVPLYPFSANPRYRKNREKKQYYLILGSTICSNRETNLTPLRRLMIALCLITLNRLKGDINICHRSHAQMRIGICCHCVNCLCLSVLTDTPDKQATNQWIGWARSHSSYKQAMCSKHMLMTSKSIPVYFSAFCILITVNLLRFAKR